MLKIQNKNIVLTNLKNKKFSEDDEFISSRARIYQRENNKEKMEIYERLLGVKSKTKEEIKKEVEKEILEEKEKFKEKSLKEHYKIDNRKIQEIEETFKNPKLKVFLTEPINLENGNICSISKKNKKIIIYENRTFNKLYEISPDISFETIIRSIIQLDNNDIILLGGSYQYIHIYRLKDNKYFLFQKIKEDGKGYEMQLLGAKNKDCPQSFNLEWIKKLSNNKFMSISNYGFKIYSLNENNQYSFILMDVNLATVDKIYEINEKDFIFVTDNSTYLGCRLQNFLLIKKVKLKKITEKEINEKFNSNPISHDKDKNDNYNNELENSIKSLKFTLHCSEKLFSEYKDLVEFYGFSDFIILKNKYFLILACNMILIFDFIEGKQLNKYLILLEGEKNLYKSTRTKIQKWNCIDDNEFIIIEEGNIFLFELNENSQKNIELSIIAYSYFPDISDLTKMNEENRFYSNKDDCILIY